MSYSFTRDRTAELRQSFEGGSRPINSNLRENHSFSNDAGYLTPNNSNATNTNTPTKPRPTSRYYSGADITTINSYNNDYNTTNNTFNTTTNTHTTLNIDNSPYSSASSVTPNTPTINAHNYSRYNGNKPPQVQPEQVIEMSEMPVRTEPVDINTLDGFFEEVESIKDAITMINENIDAVERLHTAALMSSNEQQWSQLSSQLQNMKKDTTSRNLSIKARMTELENANSRQGQTPDGQMRRTQFSALKKRFMDTIQRYQDIERAYQQKYRQRIERQIRIVKPEATQDEIDDILDNADDDAQIFAQSLMQATRRGHAKAVLSEVQNRHDDIKNIEKTIVELHQLFMDMSLLVERQQETVNAVEQNAETAAVQLKEGTNLVNRAIMSAKATRAKKWCCFFLTIGICVMIGILVWWFGFDHKGVGGN
ncbi:serine/threonine protein phosphatase Pzh1 [Mucor velutinosus]|uniref:Serine/threonine protein phosphatase Pzh1 n=1 Tax=Mucor velutinosus TaxID=708070 RepID=A0AAN7HY59_9FUNG|nr:serine/threonine protein phosphatase Pzh1 [Mucor velutinosus]